MQVNLSPPKKVDGITKWSIDWSDLRLIAQAAIVNRDFPDGISYSNRQAMEHLTNPSHWNGFTAGQVEDWLATGYKSSIFTNLGSAAPVRKKRRTYLSDDGDDLSIEDALGGEEFFMLKTTKRDVVPGVNFDVALAFSSSVPAKVVNAYNGWVCKTVYSLVRAGIDPQVTLTNTVDGLFGQYNQRSATTIRVKKQGELTNFKLFSPMLSPAALRGFMFASKGLFGHAAGKNVASGLGRPLEDSSFKVWFDKASGSIKSDCNARYATDFPEAEMTRQFIQAMHDSRIRA